ncbi:MAG: DUF1934 domain-containing protein [Oscillospiraceae bacterium]|nr:DUF1934 domain-containing protein [Oscillospiraceae bacterium]
MNESGMKDVVITLRSSQRVADGEEESLELVTQGVYEFGAHGIRFSYQETELTGMDGTWTDFRIQDGEVTLTRRGDVQTQMHFSPGKRCDFRYDTEYGALLLGLETYRLDCALDEHGGKMEIEYDMDFEKSFLSRNKFQIDVKEKVLKS